MGVIFFFTIPGFVFLFIGLAIFGALGAVHECIVALPYAAAAIVASGELVLFYKLKEFIIEDADIPDAKHPILVGIYWVITVLLNIANAVAIVWCSYLGFRNYGKSLAAESLFDFSFEFLMIFPIVFLLCGGVLHINRWFRTGFFDDNLDYILAYSFRERYFGEPHDSCVVGVFWQTIKLILTHVFALSFTVLFLLNL